MEKQFQRMMSSYTAIMIRVIPLVRPVSTECLFLTETHWQGSGKRWEEGLCGDKKKLASPCLVYRFYDNYPHYPHSSSLNIDRSMRKENK